MIDYYLITITRCDLFVVDRYFFDGSILEKEEISKEEKV
jgi:hypothetical protein